MLGIDKAPNYAFHAIVLTRRARPERKVKESVPFITKT